MRFTLTQKFILLALDDQTGRFLTDALREGLAGCILIELYLKKRINIQRDKIELRDDEPTGSPFLDDALHLIAQKPPHALKAWLRTLLPRMDKAKNQILEDLTEKGVLDKRSNKRLWFINTADYPVHDSTHENLIKKHLYDVILDSGVPDSGDIMLIGMADIFGMVQEIVPDVEERKVARERIKGLKNDNIFVRTAGKKQESGIFKELQTLVKAK